MQRAWGSLDISDKFFVTWLQGDWAAEERTQGDLVIALCIEYVYPGEPVGTP